ncbi:MAG: peptidylprolyl isomerase [Elusimicrobiota bacterium]
MSKKILGFAIYLLSVCAYQLYAEEKVVDKVIARVNGKVILLSEYNSRAKAIIDEYQKVLTSPDKDNKINELKANILEQMIDEKLLIEKAEKDNIRVTDAEVDQGVDEISGRFPSEMEFQNEISKQAMTGEKFRQNVRNQLMVIKLINQNVNGKISPPPDEELKIYYDEHQSEMMSPEQIRVRHILITTSEERPQEESKKKIDEIYEMAKKDPSKFSSFAEEHSEGPSASQGGDLGYFSKGEMVKEFEEVAFAMEVGDISKPVKTRFGYHVIKLIGKRSSEKKTFSEAKDKLKSLLYQMKMEKQYEKFLRELRDEAKISKTDLKE